MTGGKAVVNSFYSTATVGYGGELLKVDDTDRLYGYNYAAASACVSTEVGAGLLTAGLSRYGRAGQAALAFDAASNTSGVVQAGIDIRQNGLGVANTLQVVASVGGLGANSTAFVAPARVVDDIPQVSVPGVSVPQSAGTRFGPHMAGPLPADVTGNFRVSVPQSAVRTNAQLVDDIGTRAGQWARRSRQQTTLAGRSAREVGTLQHSYAKRLLDRYQRIYGNRGLSAEVRYFERALTSIEFMFHPL